MTLVDGDPGKGKSTLTIDLAARVSAGLDLPDGTSCEPGGVVLIGAEDGLADTIRPRFDAAGGDPHKVRSLVTVEEKDGYERPLSIPMDLPIIERAVRQVDAVLVVIDPLMAFLSGDAHKDQDVRRALAQVAAMAERTGAAILIVRHLNKAMGANPLYRGGGSIGIIGAARSALLVAEDPKDKERRVLAPLKNNLSETAPSLAFTVGSAQNSAARIEWRGECAFKADQLLNAPLDEEEKSALTEAKNFLEEVLAGGPVWSQQIEKEAVQAGISRSTLKRAKAEMRVKATKESDGTWSWSLPPDGKGIKVDRLPKDGPLGPLDPLGKSST
jgi:hypothetical protein